MSQKQELLRRVFCQSQGQQVFHNVVGVIDVYALKPLIGRTSLQPKRTIIVKLDDKHVRAVVERDASRQFRWRVGDRIGVLSFEGDRWVTSSQGELACKE